MAEIIGSPPPRVNQRVVGANDRGEAGSSVGPMVHIWMQLAG